jgi:hypothetical protein
VVADLDLTIGGHDEDDSGDQWLALGHGPHGERAARRQDRFEVARPARIEVLGDDDRYRKVGR